MKLILRLLPLLLLPFSLCAEPEPEIEVQLTYPQIVPKNDTERTMLAYRDGKMAVYRAMIDKYGPNIAIRNSVICTSILGMVVRHNDTAEIERLISLGADKTICNNEPIGDAISQRRIEALKTLLAADTPLDLPDEYGKRPLENALAAFPIVSNYNPQPGSSSRAFVEGSIAVISLLVKHGADTSLKTSDGLAYSDYFARKFDGKASIHPDYQQYKQEVLRLLGEQKGTAQ